MGRINQYGQLEFYTAKDAIDYIVTVLWEEQWEEEYECGISGHFDRDNYETNEDYEADVEQYEKDHPDGPTDYQQGFVDGLSRAISLIYGRLGHIIERRY